MSKRQRRIGLFLIVSTVFLMRMYKKHRELEDDYTWTSYLMYGMKKDTSVPEIKDEKLNSKSKKEKEENN